MAGVRLEKIEKTYPNGFKAVHGIDLDIRDGEFMVLVGPSGCAKSTTLRMVAGLEEISGGKVLIGDRLVNDVEPKDRDIAMVFQNYALYPHMTVYKNMSWVLKLKKKPADEIDRRVRQAADILGLTDMLDRKPKQLSGGQMQRVAVGRAIVRSPKVFLFDEPLSNLDAKLRVQMRVEISRLHTKLKNTMIYVTHDQVEAMTMGDRICVMELGRIKQVDTPTNLYRYPANTFVAGFIGSPSMNIVSARLNFDGDTCYVDSQNLHLRIPDDIGKKVRQYDGKAIYFGIRPEHIHARETNPEAADNFFNMEVSVVENMGNEVYLYFTPGNSQYIARIDPDIPVRSGDSHEMWLDTNYIHLFDGETKENLIYKPKTQ
ncbi:MAG: sn-glycerol-3-phosphate ABC transporter ATP-binding protein UgpC [Desulfobacteraceae bacterium]|nr:sn-glycerol-3-phosphate ABC transporter ATP-binding protein UgpC [Desulfobacteraceae bacterium]